MDHHPLPLPLPRPRPLLLLFLLLLLLLLFSTATADDADVILKLAASLEPLPPGWSTLSSSGFCSWSGIKCDSSNGRVTSISLSKRGLSGTLPPDLPTLIDLQSLSLQSNQLSGALPSFANNSNLRTLYLENNNFTFVPPGFFAGLTSLQAFSIGSNPNLSPWQLPDDLAQCTALMNLMAGEANLFGSIPDIFGSLPSLQDVRLGYNNLTGSLPPSMANSGIQNLWLNNQQIGLSGSIGVLSNMVQLSQVWLHKNQFTGPIPDLSGCKNIYDLQLRDNQLTGIVPESLVSLPNLVNVSLSDNKLQGPVPVFPRSVTNVVNDDGNHYCAEAGKPCDRQVNILLHIAEDFGYPATLSDAWTGNDACDGWPFVTCDSLKKNVITVNLAKQKLSGTISPAFSNLTSLQRLLLGDNNLTGSIPRSLTGLANLQVLDVSNNDLSGKVPEFSSSVRLITTPGNAKLGTETGTGGSSGPGATGPSGSSSQKIAGGKIAAIIVIIIITCVALVAFVFWKYKKRHHEFGKDKKQTTGVPSTNNGRIGGANRYDGIISDLYNQNRVSDDDHKFFEGGNVAVPIELLQQVTDNFSKDNIIGRGGFGVVYKGALHDGTKIAVKRMETTLAGNKGLNEFQAEIAVLTKVRHRHLVALLGYCINGNERLLVYEYMPRGTLGQHLFGGQHHGYPPLSWKQRVTIALDVARGVEYLHSLAQRSFIHRDLKPSNILLGDDMRAKVADFGLVKNAPDGKYSVETRLAGTFGYLAPEYAATGRVTTKVDVFAFGVVLMEMITGRKALDDNLPDDMAHLVSFFRRIVMSRENIIKAIDETLNPDEETLASICRVAELAGHCTARDPQQRPDMGHAVGVLAPLIDQWRPASQEEQEEEENFSIDLSMTLPQALQRWQADEGSSTTFSEQSYQSSAPSKPSGFADTFTLHDGR